MDLLDGFSEFLLVAQSFELATFGDELPVQSLK
jgi:hypothetical protein